MGSGMHKIIRDRKTKKQKRELDDILEVLEQFVIGRYSYCNTSYKEGVSSKIHNRLEKLGELIVLKESGLTREKEETKALVTDISHQLKTPLAALKMSYTILREEDLREEEQEEFLGRIGRQIEHMEGLVEALVNISRLETGLIEIHKQPADLMQTLIQAANIVYEKAAKKDIAIEFELEDSAVIGHDVKWTREAVANLLDNAVKYSPSGSAVRVRGERGGLFYRIEIEDEGFGIDKSEYTEIFKRFYRGKSDGVQKEEGCGVGLYLSRQIIEKQGGAIKAVQPKKGRGSQFVIQIPFE